MKCYYFFKLSTDYVRRILVFEEKKVMLSAQKCKCLFCLLDCVVHGKEEKDSTR